jgi:F-type H+-transporting ATPase subunit delta
MPSIGAGRRYAEAAFGLAERDGAIDAWQRDLTLLAGLANDEPLARAVDSPAVPFGQRRAALEQSLGTFVSPGARNLALLLSKRSRFAILPEVSAEYDALVRESRGIVAATVTTPSALSDKELAQVRARVEQLAGAKAELTTATDATLIGGLTIRIGDRFIDASVKGRLARLRGELVQGTS